MYTFQLLTCLCYLIYALLLKQTRLGHVRWWCRVESRSLCFKLSKISNKYADTWPCKFWLGKETCSKIESRYVYKSECNKAMLSARRKCARLALFHKLYFHHSYLRDNLISSPTYISSRIDHNHKVGIIRCHTRTCQESFIPRTSQEWNHLPSGVVAIKDNSKFRSAISDIIAPWYY